MLTEEQKKAIVENEARREALKKEEEATASLKRNGIDVLEYTKGNVMYQYILDPKDTEHGAGNFLWGLLDFLVKYRDYMILSEVDFKEKVSEARKARIPAA